jgi:hypothetical protein
MFTETVANTLNRLLGVGYLVIAFGLMGLAPLVLLALLVIGLSKGYGPRFGLLLGFSAAAWGSLSWVVVPYCGGYPNIPGMLIGAMVFGVGTWGQELSVHTANLLQWPLIGWGLFRAVGRGRPQHPAWEHGKGPGPGPGQHAS